MRSRLLLSVIAVCVLVGLSACGSSSRSSTESTLDKDAYRASQDRAHGQAGAAKTELE